MNPISINLWIFGSCIGYITIGGSQTPLAGAVIGLAITSAITLVIAALPSRKSW